MAYDDNNIFAKILRDEAPACRVYEDEQSLAFLDVMPQADGHTLVLPKVPAETLFELEPDVAANIFRVVQVVARGVRAAFEPDGIMLMQFNGAAAGQSVPHFHIHIVPRNDGVALRRHAGQMADAALLEEHATRIKAALDSL